MRGKGIRITVMFFLLFVPLFLLLRRGTPLPAPNIPALQSQSWQTSMESHVINAFPFAKRLRQVSLNLLLASGQSEQNGVFISDSGLMKRIDPVNPALPQTNTGTILHFADGAKRFGIPVFTCIIPTSAAILQQNLPRFSSTVNQRQHIEDAYNLLSGHSTPVNVYNHLLARRMQYIYYRTEDNLTSLGGYYVYEQLLPRMLSTEAATLASFDLAYLKNDYYGGLYRLSPYAEVEPDTLTLFRYSRYRREYLVTHAGAGGRRTYHSLYPEQATALGRGMDVFLGGLSGVTHISSNAPYSRRLLVFGDKTALAYAPFLANHYRQVTVVDLFQPDSAASGLALENYSQVLFAYSAETFLTKQIPQQSLQWLLDSAGEQ